MCSCTHSFTNSLIIVTYNTPYLLLYPYVECRPMLTLTNTTNNVECVDVWKEEVSLLLLCLHSVWMTSSIPTLVSSGMKMAQKTRTRRPHSRILHQGPMLLSGLSLRKGSKIKCEPWWNTNTLINTTPVSDSWEWDSLIHFILIHKHTKLFHNETHRHRNTVSTESTVHRIASCFDRVCFSSIFNTVTWFIFYFCCVVEPIFRCFCLIATKEQAKHHKKMNRKVIEVSRW